MAPSRISSCVIIALFLAFSHAHGVNTDQDLLERVENLEANYNSEITALKQRIEADKEENESVVAVLEERVRELENKNENIEDENRSYRREMVAMTRRVEELATSRVHSDKIKKKSLKQNRLLQKQRNAVARQRKALGDDLNVAFTAYLDHDVDRLGVAQTLVFNKLLLNDGQGYNNSTGIFTAPASGVYSFSFFIAERDENEYRAYLVVNGKNQVDAIVDSVQGGMDMQGGNAANLRLTKGDAVYVTHQAGNHVEGADVMRTTSFSGFLIYPTDTVGIDIVG